MNVDDNKTGLFKTGDFLASLRAKGIIKVSRASIQIDKLLPLLTRREIEKLKDRMDFEALADPDTDPECRREILSTMDVCPCCQRWMGHNNPPADDGDPPYRRQTSFAFKR
jgi:hypothetical protein